MCNAKSQLTLALALLIAAGSAMAQTRGADDKEAPGAAQAASAPATATPAATSSTTSTATPTATIDSITVLARELKVEQLKRELREQRSGGKDAGGAAVTQPIPGAPRLADSLNLSQPMPKAPAFTMPPLSVVAIVGMGGQAYRANLSSGHRVRSGDTFSYGQMSYTVEDVSRYSVRLKACGKTTSNTSTASSRDKRDARCSTSNLLVS